MNGLRVSQVDCPPPRDGFGKSLGCRMQDGGGQLGLQAGLTGLRSEIFEHEGSPPLKLPGSEAGHLRGRRLGEPAFAALKPGAQQHEFWKADGLLLDEKALHLGVAQVTQSREAALEYAARLFERSTGRNT